MNDARRVQGKATESRHAHAHRMAVSACASAARTGRGDPASKVQLFAFRLQRSTVPVRQKRAQPPKAAGSRAMRPGSFARRNSSAVRPQQLRFRNRHSEQHSLRSPQTTEELNEALKAFGEHLPTVPAEGEEDGSPRRVAAPAADDAPPPPFLSSAWPAERAQQRAFLAQTAVSWSLIALVLAAYVQLLSAMGRGEAVFLALRPWLGVSKARARRLARACGAGAQLSRGAQLFIVGGGLTAALAYVTDISLWPERLFPLRLLVGAVTFMLFGFGVFFNAHEVRAQKPPAAQTR